MEERPVKDQTGQIIKYPDTHPEHDVVGKYFAGYGVKSSCTEIYFCDSYYPCWGYWMTNVNDPIDRFNVSERAIARTFHFAEDRGTYWYVSAWGSKVQKI